MPMHFVSQLIDACCELGTLMLANDFEISRPRTFEALLMREKRYAAEAGEQSHRQTDSLGQTTCNDDDPPLTPDQQMPLHLQIALSIRKQKCLNIAPYGSYI